MAGPETDFNKIHADRQLAGKESNHSKHKQVLSGVVNMGLPDLDTRPRPELFLYTFEPALSNGKDKRRLRARLHTSNKDALVIRVDPGFNKNSAEASAADGDKENGLFVLTTGEIVIKPEPGSVQRFEFTVENPGDGTADYNC